MIFSLMSVSCVQANGVMPKNFTGTWTENYADGSKKSETTYKDGKKNGISVHWYESGCPMSVHYFKEDKLNGPMIKWEKCEDIIAIGEYQDDRPWNGFFLVNPSTAEVITSTTVYESGLTYYVIEYTNGQAFKSLSKEMLDRQLNSKPIYKEILKNLEAKQ
jgi:antitoxin component YwqK of YwqJK toxin-antitoxin module